MKIAVNTRLLLPDKLEGIGWFAYETLKRMVAAHPEHEFIFIFDRQPDPRFIFGPNVTAVVAHPQARHPILWYLFFEFGVSRVLRKHEPDIFLSPDGWLSLRADTPQLAVIHDLNFEAYPEWVPRHVAWYYHRYFPKFAAKATRIATVSAYTKADLSARYHVNPNKIDIVYNGANEQFRSLTTTEVQRVRDQYTGGAPYFLFVGLIHPRKNLANQLRAFNQFKSAHASPMKFVVVGARHWWSKDLDEIEQHSTHRSDIIFLGRQGLENLVMLYGAAHALSYVSLFEGFGIPILEAMAAGVPVLTSTTSSMPEVLGGAGLTANPNDVDEIAIAMQRLATDNDLCARLVAVGHERRKEFRWDKTAKALWESVERTVALSLPSPR